MGEHTPGPWEISLGRLGRWAVRKNNWLIAEVSHRGALEPGDETKANARLIAAAPDLLAACGAGNRSGTIDGPELLEDAAFHLSKKTSMMGLANELRYKARLERVAIAKARGE